MIPEAAVEAARLAVYKARWVDAFGSSGVIATDEVIARAALEAAAQHMLAPVLALADEADNRPGSMCCKVTTYQLRHAIGASNE